jgi:outer membrane protein TolC
MAQVSNDINKLSLQQNQLEQVIDFEIIQSKTNLNDNVAAMEVQKETIDLAQEVYDNVKIKYDEGVSSSFELLEAENSLRESQTNYFEALYNAVLSKIELQKSTGTLYQF